MAVDTKQGGTTNAPAGPGPGPAATLAGMPAVTANGAFKRKRPSSLMAQANALPSVENSLDEFIAKANETLIDPSSFNSEQVRQEEDNKRKEQDALRWKATEQQMLQSQAREDSLRRQLDGLQGKLAEAEARAAVAGSGGSQDGIIADLKLRLTIADEKIASSEQKLRLTEAKVGKLETELVDAKAKAVTAAATATTSPAMSGIGDEEAGERVRVAEAKAAKAIAAARAAAAGLTVSQADLSAIESSLTIADIPQKKGGLGIGALVAAAVVAAAIAFTVAFVMFNKKDETKSSAATASPAEQQQAQPAVEKQAAPTKPTATPIEDEKPAEAKAAAEDTEAKAAAEDTEAKAEEKTDEKATDEKAAAAEEPAVEKVDPKAAKKAAAEAAAAEKAEKAAAAKEAAKAAAAEKAEKAAAAKQAAAAKAAAKKTAAPKKTTATKKASGSGIEDPFGDSPAPKKAAKKKDTGIVDPF